MATRFLAKLPGIAGASAIANDAAGLLTLPNLPNAAGIAIDMVDHKLKYNQNGVIVTIPDSVNGLTAPASTNLILNTTTDSKPVLVNSRNYTQATGDSIGLQSKPSQTVITTGDVFGAQFSPRLQDTITAHSLVGVSGEPITKGASAGTIGGDVQAFRAAIDLNVATGTRIVSGTVSALYAYLQAPSAGTYTGGAAVIHVPVSDQKPWDYLLYMPVAGQFFHLGAPTTLAGSLKIMINTTPYYIALYSTV